MWTTKALPRVWGGVQALVVKTIWIFNCRFPLQILPKKIGFKTFFSNMQEIAKTSNFAVFASKFDISAQSYLNLAALHDNALLPIFENSVKGIIPCLVIIFQTLVCQFCEYSACGRIMQNIGLDPYSEWRFVRWRHFNSKITSLTWRVAKFVMSLTCNPWITRTFHSIDIAGRQIPPGNTLLCI